MATSESAQATPTPEKLVELPRGGPDDPARLPRRRLLRRAAGQAARRARDRLAGAGGARSSSAQAKPYARKSRPVLPAMELIAVVAAAHPGPGRPLQPAPARLGHPPLPEGRAQGQGAADPRHPARPLGLLHRDQAAAQVAQGARRRARAGPGVADGARARSPGKVIGRVGAREVNATTAWLDQLVTHVQAAAEAPAGARVHRRHGPGGRAQAAQGAGVRAQRRRLRQARR